MSEPVDEEEKAIAKTLRLRAPPEPVAEVETPKVEAGRPLISQRMSCPLTRLLPSQSTTLSGTESPVLTELGTGLKIRL